MITAAPPLVCAFCGESLLPAEAWWVGDSSWHLHCRGLYESEDFSEGSPLDGESEDDEEEERNA